MSESLRALVVIIVLSLTVLYLVRPAIVQIIPADTFDRWRKLWFFTTLAWFLSGNYWLYVFVMVVGLTIARKKEKQILGLYFLLLFAAPSIQMPLPGFGVMDHFFMLDHYRLLALLLLLPASMRLIRDKNTPRLGQSPVDWLVLSYLVLTCVLSMQAASATNAIRMVFLQYVDGFLPYYVASRSIKNADDVRGVLTGFLTGALLLSVLAIFEVLRSWKLYSASIFDIGHFFNQNYKMRGPFLRPAAAVQDSIVIGLCIVVAMGVLLYLQDFVKGKLRPLSLWAVLGVGLLASLSRAPWMAAMALPFLYVLQGEKVFSRFTKIFIGFGLLLGVASVLPAGKVIIDLLPVVGESEQGSIEYRANWFAASEPLIERNFWFGDVNVMEAPELEIMRQGEGIIDLVNMFLSIQLHYGVIALMLFIGMFLRSIWLVRHAGKYGGSRSKEMDQLARSLISITICIMLIIFTLSAISVVPLVIWTFLGISTAFGFLLTSDRKQAGPAA